MLKPEHFSFKCPLKISDLEKTEDGHFCAKCSKDIHDLTDCSIEEVRELQRRKGSICGFVRAVSVTSMVSLAACSKNGTASQKENQGNPETPPQSIPVEIQPELMGDICIPEELTPKPPAEPKPGGDGNAQIGSPGETPAQPKDTEVIKPLIVEPPILMGKICPPERLKPEEPKPLDPHRDGSPG